MKRLGDATVRSPGSGAAAGAAVGHALDGGPHGALELDHLPFRTRPSDADLEAGPDLGEEEVARAAGGERAVRRVDEQLAGGARAPGPQAEAAARRLAAALPLQVAVLAAARGAALRRAQHLAHAARTRCV